MEFFFRSKNNEINLKNNAIVKYEYKSYKNLNSLTFNLRVVLNVRSLHENELDYIRNWMYEDKNFYIYLSFGNIFMEKIVKEIIFPDAYIFNIQEEFDFIQATGSIILDISQKEDKYQDVVIFPKVLEESQKSQASESQESEISDLLTENFVNISETQNVELFREKLKKQDNIDLIPEYREILIEKFAYAPENIQNIFLNYVPDNSVNFTVIKEGELDTYDMETGELKMDLVKDFENPKGSGATYFHEHGHLIDLKALKHTEGEEGSISNDEKFIKYLHNDFYNFLETYKSQNNVDDNTAYLQISESIMDIRYNVVSDLFGGISEGKCQGLLGHIKTYWKEVPRALEQEAVAHFFELQFDPERLEMTKPFFPKSIERFKRLMIRFGASHR